MLLWILTSVGRPSTAAVAGGAAFLAPRNWPGSALEVHLARGHPRGWPGPTCWRSGTRFSLRNSLACASTSSTGTGSPRSGPRPASPQARRPSSAVRTALAVPAPSKTTSAAPPPRFRPECRAVPIPRVTLTGMILPYCAATPRFRHLRCADVDPRAAAAPPAAQSGCRWAPRLSPRPPRPA